jgi:hypothetical protein
MGRFIFNTFKACMLGISAYCAMAVFLILYNGVPRIGFLLSCSYVLLPLLLMAMCLFFGTREKRIMKIDDCEEYYRKISWLKKKHLVLLVVLQLFSAVLFVQYNYTNFNKLETLYPKAVDYLNDYMSATDTTFILLEMTPTWYTERLYYAADLYVEVEELDTTEYENQADKLVTDYNTYWSILNNRRLIGIIIALVLGTNTMLLQKYQHYKATMSFLEDREQSKSS